MIERLTARGTPHNALPFLQLHRALQRIEGGTGVGGRVLVTTVESSKWVVSGMALRHVPQAVRRAG